MPGTTGDDRGRQGIAGADREPVTEAPVRGARVCCCELIYEACCEYIDTDDCVGKEMAVHHGTDSSALAVGCSSTV